MAGEITKFGFLVQNASAACAYASRGCETTNVPAGNGRSSSTGLPALYEGYQAVDLADDLVDLLNTLDLKRRVAIASWC